MEKLNHLSTEQNMLKAHINMPEVTFRTVLKVDVPAGNHP